MSRPAKRRRPSPVTRSPVKAAEIEQSCGEQSSDEGSIDQSFFQTASQWNLEQDYERMPRKQKGQSKESSRLPTKTADGLIHKSRFEEIEQTDASPTGSDNEAVDGEPGPEGAVNGAVKPQLPPAEEIFQVKEQLAKIAEQLNENPEDHVGALRVMAEMGSSSNVTVKKLVIATQMTLYKDLIPGYRIRPLSAQDQKEKVSRETRGIRNFEQSLVRAYQEYLKHLAQLTSVKAATGAPTHAALSKLAVSCACSLLQSVPHFNFRGELLKIIISRLSLGRSDANFGECLDTIESFFDEDTDGAASLEAVTIISRMIKDNKFDVDESILNLFLRLKLLDEFSSKGSADRVDKPRDSTNSQLPKSKRQFLTKKQRKALKREKAIEKDFSEADAVVDSEQREKYQAEMLKLVFSTYFKILKMRSPRLMGAVLEGLTKYSHLINQDFFGDLLEVLRELAQRKSPFGTGFAEGDANQSPALSIFQSPLRQNLLCVSTAFALLEGQDVAKSAQTLHLDLSFFITHLYNMLHTLSLSPDLEQSAKYGHLQKDPESASSQITAPSNEATAARPKINVDTTTVLLIRSLSAILTLPRNVQPLRLAAFTKQLCTCALHMPERSDTAVLGLVDATLKTKGKRVVSIWNTEERRGDGVFDPFRSDCEGSKPLSATVWEGELLRHHFSPKVRDGLKAVEKSVRSAMAK